MRYIVDESFAEVQRLNEVDDLVARILHIESGLTLRESKIGWKQRK